MIDRCYYGFRTDAGCHLTYFNDDALTDLAIVAEASGWELIVDLSWGREATGNVQIARVLLMHATRNMGLARGLAPFLAQQVVCHWEEQWQLRRDDLYRWIIEHEPVLRAVREERNGGCSSC